MSFFAIYEKLSEEEILESAQKTIQDIQKWFADNPKKRICKAELWYGRICNIKRKTIIEDINGFAKQIISEKK